MIFKIPADSIVSLYVVIMHLFRSAFASVVRDEEVRERSDTFESRGTEGTGVYGSADDRRSDLFHVRIMQNFNWSLFKLIVR